MTSHDVVSRLRRVYRTRRIGHAGTLDPMATGVLVMLFGEATKLSSVLTMHEKRYVTRVRFGMGTDSLDADGKVTARKSLPDDFSATVSLDAALRDEAQRTLQVPPAVSAIRVQGQRAHALARAGGSPDLPPRDVKVHSLTAQWASPTELDVELVVSKGYYVRALARDLGEHFGAPAHLTSLRRTASGAFGIDLAVPLPTSAVPLLSLAGVSEFALKSIEVTEEGAARLRQGKTISPAHLTHAPKSSVDPSTTWVARHEGSVLGLVEVGAQPGSYRVKRGIHDPG